MSEEFSTLPGFKYKYPPDQNTWPWEPKEPGHEFSNDEAELLCAHAWKAAETQAEMNGEHIPGSPCNEIYFHALLNPIQRNLNKHGNHLGDFKDKLNHEMLQEFMISSSWTSLLYYLLLGGGEEFV